MRFSLAPLRLAPLRLAPLLCLLAGCASPNPKLYTLARVPGPAAASTLRVIEIRHVGLARYLDRPGIVTHVDAYRVTLADDARWAEPLPDMLARVVATDLGARLPGSTVFTAASAISAEADVTVEIDIQRFDAGTRFDLVAALALQRAGGAPKLVTVNLSAPPPGDEESQIATMSALLGELADRIAALIRDEKS
jgi:uncharacterized lipoprotein YmbA